MSKADQPPEKDPAPKPAEADLTKVPPAQRRAPEYSKQTRVSKTDNSATAKKLN